MSELLVKLCSRHHRRVFSWVLSMFERWRWNTERLRLLGAGSVTGAGLTINRLTQPVNFPRTGYRNRTVIVSFTCWRRGWGTVRAPRRQTPVPDSFRRRIADVTGELMEWTEHWLRATCLLSAYRCVFTLPTVRTGKLFYRTGWRVVIWSLGGKKWCRILYICFCFFKILTFVWFVFSF